jgi:excisionase family DNA binding protein
MLTIADVAARLTCSPGFVRRLIKRGKLRAIKDGRFVRIPPEAVEEYLQGHTTQLVVISMGEPESTDPPIRPARRKPPPLPGPRKVHF